ncbi:hypothetical protein V1477_010292 [Vespula maculifrons]|uniref:Uncharacterized protein n=1 Tax=Vespula maculifrons TaxID=7453 RepID=A0ABD2C861_VESMC
MLRNFHFLPPFNTDTFELNKSQELHIYIIRRDLNIIIISIARISCDASRALFKISINYQKCNFHGTIFANWGIVTFKRKPEFLVSFRDDAVDDSS